jgi:hypothetical protein
MKIAIMNRMMQATRAILTILFIVAEYSIHPSDLERAVPALGFVAAFSSKERSPLDRLFGGRNPEKI